jgi:hypothetical protein
MWYVLGGMRNRCRKVRFDVVMAASLKMAVYTAKQPRKQLSSDLEKSWSARMEC